MKSSPAPLSRRPALRRGFLLFEVVLALGVFGIAATAFAVALQRTADLATTAQHRVQITRILESALNEALSQPTMTEGTNNAVVEELSSLNMEMDTTIKALPEIENQDGQLLQQMYEITVTARWFENGLQQEESAQTWRYAQLYQP
jgi:type II secretory pathway pseudopilin PulG